MNYTIGIDIGTYETKGVLVDNKGVVVSEAKRKHKMLVPKPGWAEHRPEEDWWEDFCFVSKAILKKSGINPKDIKAIANSAHMASNFWLFHINFDAAAIEISAQNGNIALLVKSV